MKDITAHAFGFKPCEDPVGGIACQTHYMKIFKK
ncbi:MAG: hypothetical protein JWR61_1955 [Ferruginibacter sp.]|nr:hypothetical protein [Ferruginibacter sp.]